MEESRVSSEEFPARYSPDLSSIGFTDSHGVARAIQGKKSGKGWVFQPADLDEQRALDLYGLRPAPKKQTEKE